MGNSVIDPSLWNRYRLFLEESQGVSTAILSPNTKEMTILANIHLGVGCSYHRVEMPMAHLRDTNTMNIATWSDTNLPNLQGAQIVIFNRVPTFDPQKLRNAIKEHSVKLVVDIDDHWVLYPHHEMAKVWKESKANEQIQQWLAEADMVFTTNERLKSLALAINSNVWVVPNALPYGHGNFSTSKSRSDEGLVRFMYAAGSSHLYDLEMLRPVMKKLGNDAEFRKKGEVILGGYDHEHGTPNVDSVWLKMLGIVKPAKSYKVMARLPIDRYMDTYRYADVALAPLEGNSFNACKSNLKILEAGCKSIPIICSDVEPYTLDAECPGVILCSTTKDWYDAIKRLMNNKELREELGAALARYVREKYALRDANDTRAHLFRRLIK